MNRDPLILLVEDNAAVRSAFATLLEESGYRVAEAGTGADAVESARRDPPDLVLMDLGLPDLNGLEVARRLKSDPATRDAVVVAVTGRTLGVDADAEAFLAAGCAGWLTKPVSTAELLARIPIFLGTAGRETAE